MDLIIEAEKLWTSAVELAFLHDQSKALECIEKALAIVPNSAKYAVEKAEILCELGKIEEAVVFLSASKFLPPELITKELGKIQQMIAWDRIVLEDKTAHEKLTRLIKWANENGMDTSNIKVVYYSSDFRGVHANRRIRKNEKIITVPNKLLVTLPKIYEASPLAKKVAECGVELEYPFPTALACMVYEASSIKSWWQPYIESFPESADTFPYFFNETEREFLRGTAWEPNIKKDMEDSAAEYEAICQKLPEFKEMTVEVYLRLTTLVCSRYFFVEQLPGTSLSTPVVDMFNYYTDKKGQTSWDYNLEENIFSLTALEDINWGEVIALNYGSKPNGRYLLYYGFVPENNDYIYVLIDPHLSDTDPLLKAKQELLGYEDEKFLYARIFYFDWSKEFDANEEAMSACRFAAFKGNIEEIKGYLEKHNVAVRYKVFTIPPLSAENELDALEVLKQVAIIGESNYPNRLEVDEDILETQKNLSQNSKNALAVRISELKAYRKIIVFAERMIALLKNPSKARDEVEAMDSWYKEYAERILLPLLD